MYFSTHLRDRISDEIEVVCFPTTMKFGIIDEFEINFLLSVVMK